MALGFGDRLGPYEIIRLIGAGGTGEVYRARDPRLGRDVAIRVLPASLTVDTERRARVEREVRATGSLNHPNIPSVLEMGLEDGHIYIVSEFLSGATLARSMESSLPLPTAMDVAVQVAQGLAAAHAQGVVHCDLRPQHLFVTTEGRVKILDFGLANAGPGLGLQADRVDYLSPEQTKGPRLDQRSDIFAFGCVLYEMLTGRRAFGRATTAETLAAIVTDEPPEIGALPLPPRLVRIMKRCLEKEPAKRFQSAQDLAFALKTLSGEALARSDRERGRHASDSGSWPPASAVPVSTVAAPASAPAPARGPGRRRAVWAVLLLAAAAAAVAATLILRGAGRGRHSDAGSTGSGERRIVLVLLGHRPSLAFAL